MYKLLIWDSDGTLVKTPYHYVKYMLEKTLAQLGASKKTKDKIRGDEVLDFWYSKKRDDFLISKVGYKNLPLFWKYFIENDTPEERNKAISLYPDFNTLRVLKPKNKLKYALITNAHPKIIEMEVNFMGKDLFDLVVSCHSDNGLKIKAKPDTAGILYILDKLNIKKEEALMIGNSEEDVLCAQTAGVKDIYIDRKEHKLNGFKPSLTLESLTELFWLVEDAN